MVVATMAMETSQNGDGHSVQRTHHDKQHNGSNGHVSGDEDIQKSSEALKKPQPHAHEMGQQRTKRHASARFVGGNTLEKAEESVIKDYVARHMGHTVITRVLIANNGLAAAKCIRDIRRWCNEKFGNDRAIEIIVMATSDDISVNAEFIRMSDSFIEVPGGSNQYNYANVQLIVDCAERRQVHAVWAGWGHASENPRLPEALAASSQNVVFIGPPGSAMRSLGDKISSTIVAQHAKVPCMGWSGNGLDEVVADERNLITVPDHVYQKACTTTWQEGLVSAEMIGWPIMIKASEGGGGKGIRKVTGAENFAEAFRAVESEVPGSPIFIMKLMAGESRHLEVQLLADQYGNAISLFGRDCSVQRRHQKIIEEAPITVAKSEVIREMEEAAVRLAKLVGYVSAGTVEWLYDAQEGKFFFLELNPRLQVEHPCTERVSGVNLPAAQLQIAMGIPIYCISDIRKLYGQDPAGMEDFTPSLSRELYAQFEPPKPHGHVIAVRITAENPDAGFKPSSGNLQELNFQSDVNVWGYFSVGATGGLHEFADSQFGHVFAWGPDRHESRRNMINALKKISIRGDFRTTVEVLVSLLEAPAFENNTITTGWLDRLISNNLTAERPETHVAILCGAVAKAHFELENKIQDFKRLLEKGQLPGSGNLIKTSTTVEFIYDNIKYRFLVTKSSAQSYVLTISHSRIVVGIRTLGDGGLLILLGNRSHPTYLREEVGASRVTVDGKTCLLQQERDPTQLRSPSPGKLVKYTVEDGSHVSAGQTYAEIEVMKMYMPLIATEAGTISLKKQPGATIQPGDLLGTLTLDDPSQVNQAKPFAQEIPDFGVPFPSGNKPYQQFEYHNAILEDIMDGYDNDSIMRPTLETLRNILHNPLLPYSEADSLISNLSGRIPAKLESQILEIIKNARKGTMEFPAKRLTRVIDGFLRQEVKPSERNLVKDKLAPLTNLTDQYANGLRVHEWNVLAKLLDRYVAVERLFGVGSTRDDDVILNLRESGKADLNKVVDIARSHQRISAKNSLVRGLLNALRPNGQGSYATLERYFSPTLKGLADLAGFGSSKVALKARELLIACHMPSIEERAVQMEQILKSAVIETSYGSVNQAHRPPAPEIVKEVIESRYNVFDVLPVFFAHTDNWVALAALEVYVRRAYRAYVITSFDHFEGSVIEDEPHMVSWTFQMREPQSSASPSSSTTATPRISSIDDFRRISSLTDLGSENSGKIPSDPVRFGVMIAVHSPDNLESHIESLLNLYPNPTEVDYSRHAQPPNVLNVAINIEGGAQVSEEDLVKDCRSAVELHQDEIRRRGVRRCTFILCRKGTYPQYITYRDRGEGFTEDTAIRNIEPALGYQLELSRLSAFHIEPVVVDNPQIHVYYARGKEDASDQRFFIRALVRPGKLRSSVRTRDYLTSEADKLLGDILDELEIRSSTYGQHDMNHIFINFIPTFGVTLEEVSVAIAGFLERHGKRLLRLRVNEAEIRMALETNQADKVRPVRFFIKSTTGYSVRYYLYEEVKDQDSKWIFKSLGSGTTGPLHLLPITTPYTTKEYLQPRRLKANQMGTTMVFDFPEVFIDAFDRSWSRALEKKLVRSQPDDFFQSIELVLDAQDQLQEVDRPPGSNTIGMVAWKFVVKTPEYPQGRRILAIANDITFASGSFGPKEDHFFHKVSEYARRLGIPRVYIAANSGARIGLAEEIMPLFKIAFNDVNAPEAGFKYLYLQIDDYERLKESGKLSVNVERVVENDEIRYKIVDIIGLSEGLGVECLKGSGLIAGETSRAYDEIFTISLVTARSVGIGAYLVRLGQRTIQVDGTPIILTGAPALNKVLGREVYNSNLQLGGPQIMYTNGISHKIAKDDLDGVYKMVEWLSYVPENNKAPIPCLKSSDPPERDVEFSAPSGAFDPRLLLNGRQEADHWVSGIFDKGSWIESMSSWARTVIVGRARLGGIPVGAIAVETRSIERIEPADPANAASTEQISMEAGQVWYPNSAFKTAQAIRDFNHGERLPLIIFANWRGFSGGQRDMQNEVLKFGAQIVDALVDYKQPIMIHIVPNGELRGGAWVVLDTAINAEMIEMTADPTCRAGVLEPEGIVEVKFKREKQRQAMERLDEMYKSLKEDLRKASLSIEERAALEARLLERERQLGPIYQQVAIEFADLHDRVGRMVAKGAIRRAVEWKESRRYFYWRLRRRLAVEKVLKEMSTASPDLPRHRRLSELEEIVRSSLPDVDWEEDDKKIALWLEDDEYSSSICKKCIDAMRIEYMSRHISSLISHDGKAVLKAFVESLDTLSEEDRRDVVDTLRTHPLLQL